MIKAIIFDVDGVLIDSFEGNLDFYQRLMEITGYPGPTRENYPTMFHLPMKETIRELTGSIDEEEIDRIWTIGVEKKLLSYNADRVTLSPGVPEMLEKLQEKYRLAIVTSRTKQSITSLPQLKSLEHYFEVIVGYQDTTHHKPDPEPLLLACEKLGVKPDEVVYVGDAFTDVIAARAAGTKVIAYPKPLENAHGHVILLTDLPDAILYL